MSSTLGWRWVWLRMAEAGSDVTVWIPVSARVLAPVRHERVCSATGMERNSVVQHRSTVHVDHDITTKVSKPGLAVAEYSYRLSLDSYEYCLKRRTAKGRAFNTAASSSLSFLPASLTFRCPQWDSATLLSDRMTRQLAWSTAAKTSWALE